MIQDGVMGTRDEETRRFFKHSSVQVLLCPRSAGKRHSFVKQQVTTVHDLFSFSLHVSSSLLLLSVMHDFCAAPKACIYAMLFGIGQKLTWPCVRIT